MNQLEPPFVTIPETERNITPVCASDGVSVKSWPRNRSFHRRLWPVGLFLAVWTAIGIAGSVHCYFSYASLGEPMSWPRAFALGMSLWYAWAILSVVIYWWTRLIPLEADAWLQRLALHFGAGIIFALAKLVMDFPIIKYIYCSQPELCTFPVFFRMAFVGYFFRYLLISWLLMGVAHAVWYFQEYREREARAKQMEARLTEARLQILRMQMQPHFLLNALNTIASLIHSDLERADEALCKLGDLFRFLLEHSGVQEVSIREELDFIASYLEIERLRYGVHVSVNIQVDRHLWPARVPPLLLQPLVENALRHGINSRGDSGIIDIQVRQTGDKLRLEVLDDGPGLRQNKSSTAREGVGLTNTRARLQELYPNAHHFEICNRPSGGVRAVVELPLRENPAYSPAEESAPLANENCAKPNRGNFKQPQGTNPSNPVAEPTSAR
jgi:signal transduction histidine kinase